MCASFFFCITILRGTSYLSLVNHLTMKTRVILSFLLCLAGHWVQAQGGSAPHIGLYTGYTPLKQRMLVPAPPGEFIYNINRAVSVGASVVWPIGGSGIEGGVSIAYFQQRFNFFYLGAGSYGTDGVGDLHLTSLRISPSLLWRPSFAKGGALGLAVPVAQNIGTRADYILTITTPSAITEQDVSNSVANHRNDLLFGPELSLSYRFMLAESHALTLRLAAWMPLQDLFKANEVPLPTFQQRFWPSLELGWEFSLRKQAG